jgi:drug/metabolite transporter (DMT)-like permease
MAGKHQGPIDPSSISQQHWQIMGSQHAKAFIALLATMVVWGSSAAVMRKMALDLAPENSIALRYVILAAIFVPALFVTKGWRVRLEDWPRLLFSSIVGMLGYNWFVNEGFARVAAGFGTVITMVEPIIIAVLAALVLKEKLSASIYAGMAVSVIGAITLFWPDIVQSTATPVDLYGICSLVIACTCWAIYTIAAKPLLEPYGSFNVTAWTLLLSAPVLIGLASKPIPALMISLTGRQWGMLLYLVIPNALLGTLFWNYGSARLPGAMVGSFLYLIPVVAVIAGALLLAEPITFNLVAGGLVMLAGVAIAQFGPALLGQKASHAH